MPAKNNKGNNLRKRGKGGVDFAMEPPLGPIVLLRSHSDDEDDRMR